MMGGEKVQNTAAAAAADDDDDDDGGDYNDNDPFFLISPFHLPLLEFSPAGNLLA